MKARPDPIAAAAAVFGHVPKGEKVFVALSGGKDSLVVLDLAVRYVGAENVEAFYMYLVRGLRCVETPVERAAARVGVPVAYVPHHDLSRYIRKHILRHYVEGEERIRLLKQSDTEAYLRQLSGIRFFAYGMKAADSIVRNAMLKRCEGFDAKTGRLYPAWRFNKSDVYGYLKARRIPPTPILGKTGAAFSGGINLTDTSLAWLKDNHPEDFKRLLEVFPLADAAVFRFQRMGDVRQAAKDAFDKAKPAAKAVRR